DRRAMVRDDDDLHPVGERERLGIEDLRRAAERHDEPEDQEDRTQNRWEAMPARHGGSPANCDSRISPEVYGTSMNDNGPHAASAERAIIAGLVVRRP